VVRRGQGRFVRTVIYPESGVFTWSAGLQSDSSSYGAIVDSNPCFTLPDPYASQTALQRPIIVVPPNWPKEPLENDLAFIKTGSSDSGYAEVHTRNAASGYQTQASHVSPFSAALGNVGVFQLVDLQSGRGPELVYIQTSRTALGEVEVGWAPLPPSPGSENVETSGSDLPSSRHGDGWFELADMNDDGTQDLVFVQTRNTGTGRVEIHWLQRRTRRTFLGTVTRYEAEPPVPTRFGTENHGQGAFQMRDMDADGRPDLVFIKTVGTGSPEVEVHWLSAASNYQAQVSTAAAIGAFERSNGTFDMSDMDGDNRPDLVFIKTRNTGSGWVEVHWLSGASGYRTKVPVVTKFGPWEHGNGRFSMIDADGR
jgi:hypothetical protein